MEKRNLKDRKSKIKLTHEIGSRLLRVGGGKIWIGVRFIRGRGEGGFGDQFGAPVDGFFGGTGG